MFEIEFYEEIENEDVPVYFKNEYQSIFANYDKALFRVLKLRRESGDLYLPILIRPLNGFFEAYSAYGYGGIIGTSQIPLSDEDFEKINGFLKEQKVVNLFLRNSPFLGNERFIPEKYNFLNRITYIVNLREYNNFDELKSCVGQNVRWAVNYAQRNSLTIEKRHHYEIKEEEIIRFYNIYLETMKFRNAPEYYYFSKDFFLKHFEDLKDMCELYLVKKDEEIIAGSIFLNDSKFVHYHFSAADVRYYKFQPMDLMILKAIFDYGNEGKKIMHLGGGLSSNASDGLSKFKKKFADEERKFYISKVVVDEENYYRLKKAYGVEESNMFLIGDALKAKKESLR